MSHKLFLQVVREWPDVIFYLQIWGVYNYVITRSAHQAVWNRRWANVGVMLGPRLRNVLCLLGYAMLDTVTELILLYFAFCTIMKISRRNEARSRNNTLLLSNDFKGFVWCICSTIDSTARFKPLYSLVYCTSAQPRWQTSDPAWIRTHYVIYIHIEQTLNALCQGRQHVVAGLGTRLPYR